jgi:hypothetical protein
MKTGVFMDKSHQKSHLSMKIPLFMDKWRKRPSGGKTDAIRFYNIQCRHPAGAGTS